MKKIGLIFILLLLLTGCSFIDVTSKTYDQIIDETLSKKTSLYNNVYNGYKLYIPRGLKVIDKNEYNLQILDADSIYYLYVDIVSYYYKEPINYVENSKALFSKKINYNDKNGYVEIKEVNGKYFVEINYNYSKVQAYLEEKDLKTSIYNILYILSSIKYNDKVIDTIIGENILDFKEEKVDLFKQKSEKSNFLEALEKYDVYIEKEVEDQDNLKLEELE